MIRHARKLIHIAPTLAFMLIGEDAMAGFGNNGPIGTIVYESVPQSIPALSGSMLVVLGFLFAVLAFRALRAHSASKPLASIVAVGVLILGAASGNQLIQNAQATDPSLFFSNPSGGVLNVTVPGESPVLNNSGQLQRVISVTATPPAVDSPTSQQPRCTSGLAVQNNNSCYIKFLIAPQC